MCSFGSDREIRMANPVVHFEITTQNVERLHAFYSQVFDWKIDADNPYKYGMTDTGSSDGINGGIGETSGPNSGLTFYIRVPNIDAALQAVAAAGGKVQMAKETVPGGPTLAQFLDPAGFRIGLIEG
jgi:predicted enzyme related to lactoylglutathione lyase